MFKVNFINNYCTLSCRSNFRQSCSLLFLIMVCVWCLFNVPRKTCICSFQFIRPKRRCVSDLRIYDILRLMEKFYRNMLIIVAAHRVLLHSRPATSAWQKDLQYFLAGFGNHKIKLEQRLSTREYPYSLDFSKLTGKLHWVIISTVRGH